jgi:hypothetical protein
MGHPLAPSKRLEEETGGSAEMIVKMKSGAEYIISDNRGNKLKQLLKAGTSKEFINLDGNGMMIRPSSIENVYSDEQKERTPLSQAWIKAIKHNLQVMRETGRMGRATADDYLKNDAVVAG